MPHSSDHPIRAALYLRISDDRAGEGLGVRRQELECRELAERLGWQVVAVYCDNDVSAHSRKKKRKDYLRMLADIRAGRITGIIAWAPDRLHRQMRELVPFIDLVTEYGTAIQTVRGGQIDLTTAIGRMNAKTLGNIAEFESEIKQERIQAKIAELVRDGKVHNGGNRPFGFRRIYLGEGPRRKIVRDEIDEDEAKLVREAVRRTLAGETTYSICGDWNERGIRTSTGRFWTNQAMRLMLLSGRIAGLKEHRRQVVGKAAWPAIISVEEHEALRALFASPERRKKLPGPRRHWMSGLLFCSDCKLAMKISRRTDNGRLRYVCPPKKMGGCGRVIQYDDLDEMLTTLVIGRLNDPAFLRELAAREDSAREDAREIADKIEADQRRLKLLQAQMSGEDAEEEDLPELAASVRVIRKRIRERRERLAVMAGANPLLDIDVDELEERWETLPPEQRAGLLRVAQVEKVLIERAEIRGRFDPGRVVLVPVEN